MTANTRKTGKEIIKWSEKMSEMFSTSKVNSGRPSPSPSMSVKMILNFGITYNVPTGRIINRTKTEMLVMIARVSDIT